MALEQAEVHFDQTHHYGIAMQWLDSTSLAGV